MPLDGTEPQILGDPRLDKLAQIERLLIDERRWCKRRLRDEYGRYCLVGAMQAVEARQSLEPIILRAARQVGGRRYWRVESFNDNPRTTHADVLRVLQRARESILASMIEGSPPPRYLGWAQALRAFWSDPRALTAAAARSSKGRAERGADTPVAPPLGSKNVEASPAREICETPR
jgi:hypothetical protein